MTNTHIHITLFTLLEISIAYPQDAELLHDGIKSFHRHHQHFLWKHLPTCTYYLFLTVPMRKYFKSVLFQIMWKVVRTYLLSTYYVPDTLLSAFYVLSLLTKCHEKGQDVIFPICRTQKPGDQTKLFSHPL